jgi:uncharacterized protein (DUF362 family)
MRAVETIIKTSSQVQEHPAEGIENKLVAAGVTLPVYNDEPPFHPPAVYPELRFTDVSSGGNHPYRLFRNLLLELGCDRRNFGSPLWNPLHNVIQPGMTVLLKPSIDRIPDLPDERLYAAVTHPSILRAVIDYAYIALDGTGRIIVAFARPEESAGADSTSILRLDSIQEYYFDKFQFEIERCDLRDPASDFVSVSMGPESLLHNFIDARLSDQDSDAGEIVSRSDKGTCGYSISRAVLSSDVFISVPKMKVHDRTGIALGLEGLADIASKKNKRPDDCPAYDRLVLKAERWLQHHSASRLNLPEDYAWRMIADLARIVTVADDQGGIHNNPQRDFFWIVDGIIGGENIGPKVPDPRPCGCLVAGENPLAVDMVTTRLMGFDIRKLRQFDLVLQGKAEFPSSDQIDVIADGDRIQGSSFFDSRDRDTMFRFRPHPSWAGRIEV